MGGYVVGEVTGREFLGREAQQQYLCIGVRTLQCGAARQRGLGGAWWALMMRTVRCSPWLQLEAGQPNRTIAGPGRNAGRPG
jgi:hypothetical protein